MDETGTSDRNEKIRNVDVGLDYYYFYFVSHPRYLPFFPDIRRLEFDLAFIVKIVVATAVVSLFNAFSVATQRYTPETNLVLD